MKVFTVGYGGRSKEDLLTLLIAAGVGMVIDVRLRPDRASMGVFVKAKSPQKGIEKWLIDSGIQYESFVELGNPFQHFPDWKDRYATLLTLAGHLLTERLHRIQAEQICLLCCEKDASQCHRTQIAEYLHTNLGAEVIHLK